MAENKQTNPLLDECQSFLAELSTEEESTLTGGGYHGYGYGYGYGSGDDDDDDDGGRRRKKYRGGKKGYRGYGDDDEGD